MKSQQLFLSFSVKAPWCGRGKAPLPATIPWCLTWLTGRCEHPWDGKDLWHSQAPRGQCPGRAIRSLQAGNPPALGPVLLPAQGASLRVKPAWRFLWQGDSATCRHHFPVKYTAFLMFSFTSPQVYVKVSLLLKGFLIFNHQSHIDVVTATLCVEDPISFGGKTEYRADFISSSLTSKFVFEHRWNT